MLVNRIANFKNKIIIKIFEQMEKLGIHILPVHYYSPVPEIRKLKTKPFKPYELDGIDMNDDGQLMLLEKFSKFAEEFNNLESIYLNNPNFGSIDSEIYYCMIRTFKPKK